MTAKVFVDSNVLVYSRDATEADTREQAHAWLSGLWQGRQGCLSFQVLQEFYVTITRKFDPGMDPEEAREDVRTLLAWNPIPVDAPLIEAAWRIEERFRLAWWDSVIVAAAQRAAARYLLSEDFQEGMDFDGLIVVNPFRSKYSALM